jgi:NitT/TauT family transport system substrate-binding protein
MSMFRLYSATRRRNPILESYNLFPSPARNANIFLLSILLTILFGSCNNHPSQAVVVPNKENVVVQDIGKPLRQIKVLPYWVPTAQFAGYYMADETGIYEKYGIKVTIIAFEPFVTPTDLMKEGKVDFAPLWLVNAIELRASGTDIVNIAQPSTRSSLMLITKKTSGINTLEDMNGKRAGIWSGFELQPKALFRKYHLDVKIIPIGSTNNLFLMDGVDITIANWFDEYHSILNSGLNADEINTFFFADYGLNFLEDGIYCLSSTMKNDPELCANFVKATFEGWMAAFNNPDKAIDIVIKRAENARLPVNRVHQKWILDRYRDLYLKEGDHPFNTILKQEDYQTIGNILVESGLINELPNFNDFYKPVFIN